MHKKSFITVLITTLLLFSMACSFSGLTINRVQVGEIQYDHQVVELGDADSVRVDVRMGAGELKIDNKAASLMEANFTYNVDSWQPTVSYEIEENLGRLSIRQPQTDELTIDGSLKYEWDLRFAPDIPMDFRINCGAGEHDLDFSGLRVTDLDVKIGAGKVKIDLSDNPDLSDIEFDIGAGDVDIDMDGVWDVDSEVTIQGGVGKILLRLPKATGVRVDVTKGIGDIDTSGLFRDGNTYTNAAYDESDVTLDITIQAGVGAIELIVAP